jgi:lipopolysaccharide transport system ATP-binding protein
VLFVSHNMSAVQDLCKRAFWLDRGRVVFSGDTRTTIASYLSKHAREIKEHRWDDPKTAPGNETVRVVYAAVEAEPGHNADYWTVETPLKLTFRFINYRPDLPLYLNFQVYNQDGVCIFNTASPREQYPSGTVEGTCNVPGDFLNNSSYTVTFQVHYRGTFGVIVEDALVFEINDVGREGQTYHDYGKWSGATRPKLDWKVRAI